MQHLKLYSHLLLAFPLFIFYTNTINNSLDLSENKAIVIKDTLPGIDTATLNKIFTKVDIEASYPGGDVAWRKFLENNLDPTIPLKKKAPTGTYTVVIQFIVDKEGKISDITALTNLGYGMEAEVIRLISIAPKWKPAMQNGRPVKAYRKQPVTFLVEREEKRKNKRD